MIKLGLGALLSLVQEEVQRSLSYAEARDRVSKDSDAVPIRIGLSEAEIELPLSFELGESDVDIEKIRKVVESGRPVDVAKLILDNPLHDLDLQMAMMDRLTIGNIEADESVAESVDERSRKKVRRKDGKSESQSLAKGLSKVHAERIKQIPWENLADDNHTRINATTLSHQQSETEGGAALRGRVKLKFKVVIKE